MIEIEKTVILQLTPEEYEDRANKIANYILSENRAEGWVSTERVHLKRFNFDANYDKYYVKMKFEKATF